MSGLQSEAEFYKHSGRAGWTPIAFTIFGIPLSVLLAFIYSALVVYIPIIGWVNAIFLAIYIFGLGVPLGMIGKKAKCRSVFKLGFLAAIVGTIGVYFSWVAFVSFLSQGQIPALPLAQEPQILWEISSEIIAEGWWENGPSGIFEWIVVTLEAGIMIIGVAMIAANFVDREVFCEECGIWCHESGTKQLSIKTPGSEAASAPAVAESESPVDESESPSAGEEPTSTETESETPGVELVTEVTMPELSDTDLSGHLKLLSLPIAGETEIPRVSAQVLTCNGCSHTQAVRFALVKLGVDDEGNAKIESEDLPGILLQKQP